MKNMKIGDLFAIGAVLLLAAVCFLAFLPRGGEGDAVAQIYQNGQLLMTVALDRPDQFPVQGDYCNTVTVKDGAIAITASDCPGSDCVHSGWAQEAGRAIICLPNRMEIRLTGSSGVDAIVG
jgi:hypothetical protein